MAPPDHAALMGAIGGLTSDVAHIAERLERMDKRLAKVEAVTQFGRGIGWAILRIGAVVAAAIALWEWLGGKF